MKLRPAKPNLRARAPAKVEEVKKASQLKIKPLAMAVQKRGRPSLKSKQVASQKPSKIKAGRKRIPQQKHGLSPKRWSKIMVKIRPMRAAEIDILLGRRAANVYVTRDPKIEALARGWKSSPSVLNGNTVKTNEPEEVDFPEFEHESDEVETESEAEKDDNANVKSGADCPLI